MERDVNLLTYFGDSPELESYAAESTIFMAGDRSRSMYIVKSGNVRIAVRDIEVAIVQEGEFFGEMAMIDLAPRSASAFALTDCELVPVSESYFLTIVDQMPYFSLDIMRILTRRLRAMNRML